MTHDPLKKYALRYQTIRWKLFHIFYFSLFAVIRLFSLIYYDSTSYRHVTSLLSLIMFLFLLLFFFKRTRRWCITYAVVPLYGLIWIVFFFRLTFDILGGVDWLSHFTTALFPGTSPQIARLGDFIFHFMPLLIIYQVIYYFKDEIVSRVETIKLPLRVLLSYMPFLFITVWSLFVDPFDNYLIPRFKYCYLLFYIGVFLTNTVTAVVHQGVYLHFKRHVHTQNLMEISTLIILLANAALGIALFGVSNLYASILQWAGTLVALLLISRRITPYKDRLTSYLLLPIFGFCIVLTLLREIILIASGGDHRHFIDLIHTSIPINPEMLYAVYLVMHYAFVVQVVAEILFEELPANPERESRVRSILLAQRAKLGRWSFVHTILNGYGCVIILCLFFIVNHGFGRYQPIITKLISLPLTILMAAGLAFVFPESFYRMQVQHYELRCDIRT